MFLDYLISKVANARSDKLAEAEATVSRCVKRKSSWKSVQKNAHDRVCYVSVTFKDGAYYCYCAYVLRISRYSDFLSPMLANTGIFLRGLKLSGETRS